MSSGSDGRKPEVRPAFSLSLEQIGQVRVHLAHHYDRPRQPTLEALGVWPHWDTIVAELEERMVREEVLGERTTFEAATAAHEAAEIELDDEQLEQLEPVVAEAPTGSKAPFLSLFAMASIFATLVAEPDDLEAECQKRHTNQGRLAEDAALWGVLFEADEMLAERWEREVAFALRYRMRNAPLDELPEAESPRSGPSAPDLGSSPGATSMGAEVSAPSFAPPRATTPQVNAGGSVGAAPADIPSQPTTPAGYPSPPAAPAAAPPAAIAPQPAAVPHPSPAIEHKPHPARSNVDATAVGVIVFDEDPMPFIDGDFVPESSDIQSSEDVGATGIITSLDLDALKAIPFDEEESPAAAEPRQSFSLRRYAALCVERQMWPDHEQDVLARYQIDASRAQALDQEFRRRFEDPKELERYYEHAAAYQQWLRENR